MQPLASPPRLNDEIVSPLLYRRLSDLDLVTKANGGDRYALAALVERHAPRVQRLASQVLEDFEEARDAAQESLVKLCTRLRQFRGDAQFATWLHRLVINTCRDWRARQRVRQAEPLLPEHDQAAEDLDPSRLALLAELRRELAGGLSRLSAQQRAAFLLRDGLGLSYEEVARAARMPVGTAKSYVHRARTRLRVKVEELHGA